MAKMYRVLVADAEDMEMGIVWQSEKPVTERYLITEGIKVVNKAFLVAIGKLDPQSESFEGHIPGDGESVGERVIVKNECPGCTLLFYHRCEGERISSKLDDDPDKPSPPHDKWAVPSITQGMDCE